MSCPNRRRPDHLHDREAQRGMGRKRAKHHSTAASPPVRNGDVAWLTVVGAAQNNLRGIDVPVQAGATEAEVRFAIPERDANYAVAVTPSWLTDLCVPEKTAEGFTVQFGTPGPAAARIQWIMVR